MVLNLQVLRCCKVLRTPYYEYVPYPALERTLLLGFTE